MQDGSNALSIALEASHNDTAVLLYAHMNYSKTPPAVVSSLPLTPNAVDTLLHLWIQSPSLKTKKQSY